jgi:hypothetical protein
MRQGRVAKQLEEATRGILAADERIRTLSEQLVAWDEMREDLHIRSLVSETPQAGVDLSGIERQCGIARVALNEQVNRKKQLERTLEILMIEWEPKVVS